MCDVVGKAVQLAEEQRISRRGLLKGSAAASAGMVAASAMAPRTAASAAARARAHDSRTRLVLLGTAGGPGWWPFTTREGIASAVAVENRVYLVDCGEGVGRQYRRSGLAGAEHRDQAAISTLRGIFLTHLHSDHIVDYANLWLWGWANGLQFQSPSTPVQIFGPGDRGQLPPLFGPGPEPPVINPDNPTPGTVEMTDYLMQAFATDLNDRLRDNRIADPRTKISVHDIQLPPGAGTNPDASPYPRVAPFHVYEDDYVRVTATLVDHRPVYPSFGFRFDTDDGSIAFSGDTAPSENLVELAKDVDILVHEVISRSWVEGLFPDPTTPQAQGLIQHLLGAHTTVEDVGGVAERAGARTLVLNHLVPPYTPTRVWLQARRNYSGRLRVGQDLDVYAVGRARRRARS